MNKILISSLLAGGVVLSASADSWMEKLNDTTKIRQMSIPGAHDAAAHGMAMGNCQSKTLSELWESGIRAFDLRPAYKNGKLTIYHGILSTGIDMADALDTIIEKLAKDSSDFAFVLVRHETDGDKSSEEWGARMQELMEGYGDAVAPFSPEMTLEDARGKIIFVTRDSFTFDNGGYAGNWGNNNPFKEGYISRGAASNPLWIQDQYNADSQDAKNASIAKMLDYSTNNDSAPTWVINYTSGYIGSSITGAFNNTIQNHAKSANKAALDYLDDATKIKGRTGIVMMDYAGDDSYSGQLLTDAIIRRNSELLSEESTIMEVEYDGVSTTDTRVFDITGIPVAESRDEISSLPSGLYICEGKKFIVR